MAFQINADSGLIDKGVMVMIEQRLIAVVIDRGSERWFIKKHSTRFSW